MNRMIQRSRENLKNKKGFTLIELIVVIVIIGILAAIVIPRLSGFTATANYKADVATAKTIATAAVTEMTSTGNSTVALTNLTAYFDGGVEPKSAKGDTSFTLTTSGGGVTSVVANGVTLYPNPAKATPTAYK